MHPNIFFRKATDLINIDFARSRSFGTLTICAHDGPLLSHIPFLLSEDGSYLEAHLVRSNPMVKLIENPIDAVMVVNGPDGYISPDWYEIEDQVPTWNYISVHLRGKLKLLPDRDLRGVIDRLSADMEARLLPKKPWTSDKMNEAPLNKMMRQIVPIKMDINEISGTWKLSQNKTDEVRLRAADGLATYGFGAEVQELANQMKDPTS